MIRIDKRLPHGRQLAKVLLQRAERLVLAFEARQHPPDRARLSDGREAALALPQGEILRDGDVLVTEDGSLVCVEAAKEPVLRVAGRDAQALAQAAYRLGEAHVPTDIRADHLRVRRDDRLAATLADWGLVLEAAELPFEPEAGAAAHEHQTCAHSGYAHGHEHHGHEHHGHEHHGHEHHGHEHHGHEPGRGHGPHAHDEDEAPGGH